MLGETIAKGELLQEDARNLAIILEATLMGLREIFGYIAEDDIASFYSNEIRFFLHGTLNR
ncbi:hypothetical protein [Paenibacillus uliginis]|uniref:hypothetical protein n=1 Tax=Paenibacillus uliginis TaxID=683737 RepID=UPI001AD82F7A|nr:hypothetical protein [Paenibacillus uliginis]